MRYLFYGNILNISYNSLSFFSIYLTFLLFFRAQNALPSWHLYSTISGKPVHEDVSDKKVNISETSTTISHEMVKSIEEDSTIDNDCKSRNREFFFSKLEIKIL